MCIEVSPSQPLSMIFEPMGFLLEFEDRVRMRESEGPVDASSKKVSGNELRFEPCSSRKSRVAELRES